MFSSSGQRESRPTATSENPTREYVRCRAHADTPHQRPLHHGTHAVSGPTKSPAAGYAVARGSPSQYNAHSAARNDLVSPRRSPINAKPVKCNVRRNTVFRPLRDTGSSAIGMRLQRLRQSAHYRSRQVRRRAEAKRSYGHRIRPRINQPHVFSFAKQRGYRVRQSDNPASGNVLPHASLPRQCAVVRRAILPGCGVRFPCRAR